MSGENYWGKQCKPIQVAGQICKNWYKAGGGVKRL